MAPIKVGVIQSQTEFMGDTGQAVINATLFAIDEINRSGGVLGRQIRPIVGDGQSDELVFAREARRLLDDEAVSVLFACLTSTHRRAVEPVVREYDRLLVYPGESEGLEQSPHVICLGPLPNQHILPAVGWFRNTLGKRRFYFVGSDTVYARAVRAILGDFARSLSVELVGESYVNPADVVGWAVQTVRQIQSIEPDAIVTLLQGKANLAFIHRLRTVRITPARIPTLSCTFTEHDLRNILGQMAGDYLCGHYYQSLKTRENARFLARMAAGSAAQRHPGRVRRDGRRLHGGPPLGGRGRPRRNLRGPGGGPAGDGRVEPSGPGRSRADRPDGALRREVHASGPGWPGPRDRHPLVVPRALEADRLPGHADPRRVGRADPGAACALGWLLVEPRILAGIAA